MQGYSLKLKRLVTIAEVQTKRMPDLSYVHQGTFTHKDGIKEQITVRVYPHEIIMDRSGHHTPAEVYLGPETPKRLSSVPAGQVIVVGSKNIQTRKENGELKTYTELTLDIKQKREEIKNEKIINEDPVDGGGIGPVSGDGEHGRG